MIFPNNPIFKYLFVYKWPRNVFLYIYKFCYLNISDNCEICAKIYRINRTVSYKVTCRIINTSSSQNFFLRFSRPAIEVTLWLQRIVSEKYAVSSCLYGACLWRRYWVLLRNGCCFQFKKVVRVLLVYKFPYSYFLSDKLCAICRKKFSFNIVFELLDLFYDVARCRYVAR